MVNDWVKQNDLNTNSLKEQIANIKKKYHNLFTRNQQVERPT